MKRRKELRVMVLPGCRSGRSALSLTVGLVAAVLVGCGGGGVGGTGGPVDPGSVVATGGLTGTFVPFALPTEAASGGGFNQITWSNVVGDTVYTVYYSVSQGLVGGLTVTASGVFWGNGATPRGNFPPPFSGGVFINTTTKVVTFSNAEISQNVMGPAPATLNGSLRYQ
jgi:hypothetical protein